jgi:hypothetical protein
MSSRLKKILVGAAVLAVAGGGGAAIVQASGEDDHTITGPQADKATTAALAITMGGKANSVERDGENGATWEVEVTKPDGKTVDVRLDDTFGLVIVENDDDSSE